MGSPFVLNNRREQATIKYEPWKNERLHAYVSCVLKRHRQPNPLFPGNTLYVRTSKPFADVGNAFGWLGGVSYCGGSTFESCTWHAPVNDYFNHEITGGNNCGRWFTDASSLGSGSCMSGGNVKFGTGRCFTAGASCNNHAMRPNVKIYKLQTVAPSTCPAISATASTTTAGASCGGGAASTCDFTCAPNYSIVGSSSTITCDDNGECACGKRMGKAPLRHFTTIPTLVHHNYVTPLCSRGPQVSGQPTRPARNSPSPRRVRSPNARPRAASWARLLYAHLTQLRTTR